MSLWLVIAVSIGVVALTIVPGLWFWRPQWSDPIRRTDLGLALISGAVIAFAVLAIQILADQRLADAEVARGKDADRQNLQLQVGSADDLTGIALPDQDLRGFYIPGKTMRDADLRGTQLNGAVMNGSILERANLTGADLTGTLLGKASFVNATLTDAVLADAELEAATLEGASAPGASLARAKLRFANLRGSELRDGDLSAADFTGADLRDVDARNANLARADLDLASLQGADLRDANLRGASLRWARYDWSTLWPPANVQPRCRRAVGIYCYVVRQGEKAPSRLQEFHLLLRERLPSDWNDRTRPNQIDFIAPDRSQNILGTSEPWRGDTQSYVKATLENLQKELPNFEQRRLQNVRVLGGKEAVVLHFVWTPKDASSEFVQLQLYFVENNLGYVFTVTSQLTAGVRLERRFRELFEGLLLEY